MELLERGAALAAVEEALGQAWAGSGRVVLIAGEAGVGKMVLLAEIVRRVGARSQVLAGACDPLLTPRALGPFHDMARAARLDAPRRGRAVAPAPGRPRVPGAHREAADHLRTAVGSADGLDPARRADLLAALSVEAYPCGESQEPMTTRREALAIRHELGDRRGEGVGERAIALAREIGDDEALAHALTNVGTALCATDRPARTSWRRPRASRCARVSTTTRRGRWSTWRNRLVHHRYEEGLVTIARGLEPAERCDLRSYGQYLIGMRSWAHLDTCDWPAAERDAEVAIAIHRAHPTTAAHPALVVMARLLTRRGDPRAGEVLDEAPAAGSPRPTRGSSARRSSGPGAPGPSRRCPWRRPSRGSHRSVATPAGRRSSGSASAARRRGSTRARRGQPRRGRRRHGRFPRPRWVHGGRRIAPPTDARPACAAVPSS